MRTPFGLLRGGVATFLVVTFVLTWIPTLVIRWSQPSLASAWLPRLLTASGLYAVSMGWQPLLALAIVRKRFRPRVDSGIGPASGHYVLLAIAVPVLVMLVSAVIRVIYRRMVGQAVPPLMASVETPLPLEVLPTIAASVGLLLATVTIYAQCFSEEVGWRSYFLAALIPRLGLKGGLVVHGIVWGLWYAPPIFLATGDPRLGILRCAAFVVTCMLLGILLGWIRLAANSIVPGTIANVTLTLTCGLPFILQATDVGLRGAAYSLAGWLPLSALSLIILTRCGRWSLHQEPSARAPSLSVRLLFPKPPANNRERVN